MVCHVLRYSPVFIAVKKLIEDGKLGSIISINHEECVGNIHQSHSFVRGNWGNSERASCMLLQKSCHDMDILQWLVGKKCKKVQSFGSLTYFRKEMHLQMYRSIVFRAVQREKHAHIMRSSCIWMTKRMIGFGAPAPEKRILRMI